MLVSWQRLFYYLGLAVVEATPAALLLTLAGGDVWGALIGVVLAGALADWVVLRRLPPPRQGPALALVGLLGAMLVVKRQVAPGAGLVGGWGELLGVIFSIRDDRSGLAYMSLIAALYCFWRGTRQTLHDTISLHRLYRVATVVLMVIVGFGFLGGGPGGALSVLASTEVLSFFAVGLITMALASASEEREAALRRMGWRGLLTLLAAVALVLLLGLLLGALFGREAAQVIALLWQGTVLIFALILAPILYLLSLLLERLLPLLHLERLLSAIQPPPQNQAEQQPDTDHLLGIFPPWVQLVLRVFFALLPILLIVALFLLSRARARRKAGADEERESLWSWQALAADLRGLLFRPAPRRAETLRDALARLRGGDPATRIRRSYIRLLIAGEARSQPRAAPQTPREYVTTAQAALPAASRPIDTLTEAYERARYQSAATPADADAAERAWDEIEQADRRAKREA